VERAFDAHPGVAESAAVAVAVREGVDVIALAYVPAGADPGVEELQAHAQNVLARYKQPRLYRAVTALPRGANNKLDRRRLRQEAWT
jgi:acyl-coenzyme A synthetase/AMP-(fatty) acid ligase